MSKELDEIVVKLEQAGYVIHPGYAEAPCSGGIVCRRMTLQEAERELETKLQVLELHVNEDPFALL